MPAARGAVPLRGGRFWLVAPRPDLGSSPGRCPAKNPARYAPLCTSVDSAGLQSDPAPSPVFGQIVRALRRFQKRITREECSLSGLRWIRAGSLLVVSWPLWRATRPPFARTAGRDAQVPLGPCRHTRRHAPTFMPAGHGAKG